MNWNRFNHLNVLIIDDDQFTRELIAIMLKDIPNVIIHQAKDGFEALRVVKESRCNLLLLDLYMPQMGGKEFLERLRETQLMKDSSVIILISTDRLTKKELQDIGANYYLTKPFDFHNFLKNIYGFLEQEMLLDES